MTIVIIKDRMVYTSVGQGIDVFVGMCSTIRNVDSKSICARYRVGKAVYIPLDRTSHYPFPSLNSDPKKCPELGTHFTSSAFVIYGRGIECRSSVQDSETGELINVVSYVRVGADDTTVIVPGPKYVETKQLLLGMFSAGGTMEDVKRYFSEYPGMRITGFVEQPIVDIYKELGISIPDYLYDDLGLERSSTLPVTASATYEETIRGECA